MRYKIVIYNAGKRIKCLGKFDKYSEANEVYQQNLVSNRVLFPKFCVWNGRDTDYELVLLGPPEGKHIAHLKDVIGRNQAVKAPEGHTVKKISPYYVEETFLHKNSGKKMEFRDLVKKFIMKGKGVKVYHTVKNKLVIEYFDSEDLDLFVLKNMDDAARLNETIREFCHANKLTNHMFFTDMNTDMRRNIYDMVEEKLGISRTYMYRESTR